MNRLLLILLVTAVALMLTACSPQVAQTALVPVAADCVPDEMPAAPVYPDSDRALLAAPEAADRYRLLIVGREVRIARLGLLEGVVDACKGGPR